MSGPEALGHAQYRARYKFKDRSLLILAWTPATKTGGADGRSEIGHLQLANMGRTLLQLLLLFIGYYDQKNYGNRMTMRTGFGSTDHCTKVARVAGLERCIQNDYAPADFYPILDQCVNAFLAAISMDSKDLNQLVQAMVALGFFADQEYGINPRFFSTGQQVPVERSQVDTAPGFFLPDVSHSFEQLLGLDHSNGTNPLVDLPNIASAHIPASYMLQPTAVMFPVEMQRVVSMPDSDSILPGNNADLEKQPTMLAMETPRPVVGNFRSKDKANGSPGGLDEWCLTYLAEERQRCLSCNWLPPERTFFTPDTQAHLQRLEKKHMQTLLLIHMTTASCHAIVAISDILAAYQQRTNLDALDVSVHKSATALFRLIEALDTSIALDVVLRRYNVLCLYRTCITVSPRGSDRFILESPSPGPRSKKPGNPNNNAKAQVTEFMMREIFPQVNPGSPEYSAKYKKVSGLQALGRRYLNLVERFGEGFLALMPLNGDMAISDSMIRNVPEKTFDKFVDILNDSQGRSLREFSDAVWRLIQPLVCGGPTDTGRTGPWKDQTDEIMQCPKGSPQLLATIS